MNKNKRNKLLKLLEELYPQPETELNFKNTYQLLIAVVLSAQCTDKKVNQTTPELFKKYPNFKSLITARVTSVEKIIRAINYYKTKSKNIIASAKKIEKEFKGKIPKTHEELITLPGVGRKTANVVLGELKVTPTFPVDTHVFRLSRRLGLSKSETVDKVEQDLMKLFAPSTWRFLHHALILHGRRVCKAQNPNCSECLLSQICPSRT